MMLEFEKKIPITSEEYMYLLKMIEEYATINKQTNFYYDTDNLDMNRQGITCRIRERNGVFTATVKEHNSGSTDCSIEISKPAKNEFDDSLFADKKVALQGCLVTERALLFCKNDLNVVIDKNTYLGCVDYEIEIEYNPEDVMRAEKAVTYFANQLNSVIKGFNCTKFYERMKCVRSKSERFFQRLEKNKANNNWRNN